ncbi:hypothetical protein Hanom_Chr11g00986881 [Helianthus anomalus]
MISLLVSGVRMNSVSTDTELVPKLFRFGKYGTGTQYHLFISEDGFHPYNIITIKHFWLIFFRLSFSVFFYIIFYSC